MSTHFTFNRKPIYLHTETAMNFQSNDQFAAIVFTAKELNDLVLLDGAGAALAIKLINELDAAITHNEDDKPALVKEALDAARKIAAQLREEYLVDVRVNAIEEYLGFTIREQPKKFNRSLIQQANDRLEGMGPEHADAGRKLIRALYGLYGSAASLKRHAAAIAKMDEVTHAGYVKTLGSQIEHMEKVFTSYKMEVESRWVELFGEPVVIQPWDTRDHVYTDQKTGAQYTAAQTVVYLIELAMSGVWTNSATGETKALSLSARRAKLHTAIDKYAEIIRMDAKDIQEAQRAITKLGDDVDAIVRYATDTLARVTVALFAAA